MKSVWVALSLSAENVQHADLYQLLAYTVATNLPAALLIYAAGEGRPAIHTTVHLGKRPNVIALDLSRSPEAILSQIAELAATISRLATLSPPATAPA